MTSSALSQLQPVVGADVRPSVSGKFLSIGDEKFCVRGPTYGPFPPDSFGRHYPERRVVELDFGLIAANGMNAVRVYEPPLAGSGHRTRERSPRDGWSALGTTRHVLDDKKRVRDIRKRTRLGSGLRPPSCRPLLCHWQRDSFVSRALARGPTRSAFPGGVVRRRKNEDPEGLFSYVNYPTDEYLELFSWTSCVQRVPRVAVEPAGVSRPPSESCWQPTTDLTELGLDSRSHGEFAQARALDWQIRTAFAAGCAGAFVFAWTDSGIEEVTTFGTGILVSRTGNAGRSRYSHRPQGLCGVPFQPRESWPGFPSSSALQRGAHDPSLPRGIQNCGMQTTKSSSSMTVSTDRTAEIARDYPVRVISTENRGLSAARNLGMEAATGEIVAYLDDDASPDPDWLSYLATTFWIRIVRGGRTQHPGFGRPTRRRVRGQLPGWPTHVLLSDDEAEHIPGCNMAFRKACLQAIGGFVLNSSCGRRRGCLLACARTGREAGLQSCGHGVATSAAVRSGRTGNSKAGTEGPRRYWRGNGRRNITSSAIRPGPGVCTTTDSYAGCNGLAGESTREPGKRQLRPAGSSTAQHPTSASAIARMASDEPGARGTVRRRILLELAHLRRTAGCPRRCVAGDSSGDQRQESSFLSSAAESSRSVTVRLLIALLHMVHP